MKRVFKYRIQLSKSVETTCHEWLEQCRVLYNLALAQRRDIYIQSKKSVSYREQQYQLSELKKAFPEFKIVYSQCLCDVLLRLDKAYKSFFRRVKQGKGKVGFPRFKSFGRYDSFTLTQSGWKLEGQYLYISKIGRLKLFLSRSIEGKIKTITIRRSSTGKWFVCFSCDDVPVRTFPETVKEVGIDVGIKSFLVDSEGNKVNNPLFLKKSLKLLRRRQQKMCKKIKGSKGRKAARILVTKVHEKIVNQRKDFLHKTSNYYIQNYKKIFIEDLQISNMIKNRHLARSIADSSWAMFFNFLSYKAEEAGRKVVKVPPYNTSQLCSSCGEKVPKSLEGRIHSCSCGCNLDRDYNAALNIKQTGWATPSNVNVGKVNPSVVRESHEL